MGRNKSTVRRDFSANIERAKEQGFEPIELLQQYADKISQ
jgi:hypothetical protein